MWNIKDKKQEVVDILDLWTEDVKMEAKSLYVVWKIASKEKPPFIVKRYFEKDSERIMGFLDNDGLIS